MALDVGYTHMVSCDKAMADKEHPVLSVLLIDADRGAGGWIIHPRWTPAAEATRTLADRRFIHKMLIFRCKCQPAKIDNSSSPKARYLRYHAPSLP